MEVLIKLSDAIKTLKSMAVPLVRKLPSAQPERLTDYSFEESCTDCPAYDTENHRCPRFNQVIRMALKDANLETCENCISRQAAIDEAEEWIETYNSGRGGQRERDAIKHVISGIKKLPSARPEPLSDAYMKSVWTWLLEYQIKAAELKGRYTPYEVLSWVVNDWRKEHEGSD